MNPEEIRDASLLDLFLLEARTQVEVLNTGLLALERDPTSAQHLEACMRASHSMKGAARIVGLDPAVRVAHVMEDCLVGAQAGRLLLQAADIDLLLRGADLLLKLPAAQAPAGNSEAQAFVDALAQHLSQPRTAPSATSAVSAPSMPATAGPTSPVRPAVRHDTPAPLPPAGAGAEIPPATADAERALRVSADTLDRLLGLSSETLVESHRLSPFASSLLQLKRMQENLSKALENAHHGLAAGSPETDLAQALAEARRLAHACQQMLGERMGQADQFGWRIGDLAQRLYDTALACRMRPFGDGLASLPRMVRGLGRQLGKQVRLETLGTATRVDRDIMERLDAPLNHLLRNAVDHGIEAPEARMRAGKATEGVITLEARHSAGMLLVEVSDDGNGIDLEQLRGQVVQRQLASAEIAAALSETELLAFLFLPGFTTRGSVTEISGRGVGLDVVHDMARQLRGTVRVHQQTGTGTRFTLELPLSLSVARSIIVDIGGELYAFPLAYVSRALQLPRSAIEQLEGRQHFLHEGRQVGLLSGRQILQYAESGADSTTVPLILLGDHARMFGIAVDRFVAERTLVVQPLDSRLGKVQDMLAGALMEDGTPVLIVDAEDMLRSIEKLVSSGNLHRVGDAAQHAAPKRRKRILVVDDSLTVRELERKLLVNRGYEVAVAVDGMDGWNMLRSETFDLLVTDVDMPRMDGIELVTLIRQDARLHTLHVMVVSYKDRQEDRQRGLDAGADYYLGKSSFHDDALLEAVEELIGRATT
jgi:two-component system sensor histidine kinase and response regulator WspE